MIVDSFSSVGGGRGGGFFFFFFPATLKDDTLSCSAGTELMGVYRYTPSPLAYYMNLLIEKCLSIEVAERA